MFLNYVHVCISVGKHWAMVLLPNTVLMKIGKQVQVRREGMLGRK